jgi:hypothetical protein
MTGFAQEADIEGKLHAPQLLAVFEDNVRLWYLQIEHLCSLKIDYEFKFCELLNWQAGRFAAL